MDQKTTATTFQARLQSLQANAGAGKGAERASRRVGEQALLLLSSKIHLSNSSGVCLLFSALLASASEVLHLGKPLSPDWKAEHHTMSSCERPCCQPDPTPRCISLWRAKCLKPNLPIRLVMLFSLTPCRDWTWSSNALLFS